MKIRRRVENELDSNSTKSKKARQELEEIKRRQAQTGHASANQAETKVLISQASQQLLDFEQLDKVGANPNFERVKKLVEAGKYWEEGPSSEEVARKFLADVI